MAQMQLLIWDTEITPAGEGRATVTARKPLHRLTCTQAAKLLGCSEWTVRRLFRLGLLSGWKPGATRTRSDGRQSNATLVLDAESVLKHKESSTRRGVF
jgi:excisionase family DNA binding protein